MQKVTPHWGWFFLGPTILVLGGIASFVVMFAGLISAAESFDRVTVPGEGVIHIAKAGPQPIFYEQQGMGPPTVPTDMVVVITPAGGGEELSILPSSGASTTYNYNGLQGRNYGTVNFPAAGDYKVSATLPLGTTGGNVAFAGGAAEKAVGSVLAFLGIGGGSFVLCVIIMIVVAVKRSSSRKRLFKQQYANMPQGGMSPPPPPGASPT